VLLVRDGQVITNNESKRTDLALGLTRRRGSHLSDQMGHELMTTAVDMSPVVPPRQAAHGKGVGRSLVVEVASDGGEERLGHRHQPLMAALALGDEHPPLTQAQILEAQPTHLAATQPAQQHCPHDRPVPLSPQRRHQRLHLGRLEDPRQTPHAAHQRHRPPVAMAALAGRQALRHRIGGHLAPGDQEAIQARHRSQSALDRRRRQAGATSEIRTTFSAPGRGRCWALTNNNTSRDVTSTGSLSTIEKSPPSHARTPAPWPAALAHERTPRTRRSDRDPHATIDRHRRPPRTGTTETTSPHTSRSDQLPPRGGSSGGQPRWRITRVSAG
jgi:hypothetical protein